MCSVIIPVFNDADALKTLLLSLQSIRQQGHEIIVVDGKSVDQPLLKTGGLVDQFLVSEAGRSIQMNLGATQAKGDILWFIHADSELSVEVSIQAVLSILNTDHVWGRFDISLSNNDWRFKIIGTLMNIRSRLTGIATGDQGIFILSDTFNQIHGFKDIKLMEDIELSKSLKKISSPLLLNERITTSTRRWEAKGILSTVLLMWFLRFAYFMGISPNKLAKLYSK